MNMFCWFSDPWLDFVWIWKTISSSAFVNKCNYMNPGGFLAQYPLENPLGYELYIYTTDFELLIVLSQVFVFVFNAWTVRTDWQLRQWW